MHCAENTVCFLECVFMRNPVNLRLYWKHQLVCHVQSGALVVALLLHRGHKLTKVTFRGELCVRDRSLALILADRLTVPARRALLAR